MKVAVAYENGDVFQHFGKTEQFKVYEIHDNNITDTFMVGADEEGHIALANLIQNHDIDAIIGGNIGPGVQQALTEAGIRFYSGVSGDADEAVRRLIGNSLEPAPVSKARLDEAIQSCGHSCKSDCHGNECGGGNCSGCH